jgi:glutamyl-tRNA reductase
MLLVDLGVPRNMEPELRGLEGIHLYDIDDLRGIADADRERRRAAMLGAERLVDRFVSEFQRERARRESAPLIGAFRRHLEQVAALEYESWLPAPGREHSASPAMVRHLLNRVIAKMLHQPSVRLQQVAEEGKVESYAAMLERLFDLSSDRPRA